MLNRIEFREDMGNQQGKPYWDVFLERTHRYLSIYNFKVNNLFRMKCVKRKYIECYSIAINHCMEMEMEKKMFCRNKNY